MRLPIVKIGRSSGVRLPQSILRQCGVEGQVSMEVDGDSLIIRAHHGDCPPRSNVIHINFGDL
jgi:antitoxin component of MazEF toxin-antitoxin module